MENNINKAVLITFGTVSILVGYVVFAALFKLAGVYDLETRVKDLDLVIRLVSIGAAALLFLILYKNDTANQFMHETVTELARVTWPTNKETLSSTWVVVVMVLLTGLILGLFDKLWTLVIQWIL